MIYNKGPRYKMRSDDGDGLDIPEEGQKPIPRISQSEISNDQIILKLQAGDYSGAHNLLQELTKFQGTEEEKGIIEGIISQVKEYILSLPPEKQKEIANAIQGNLIPGGSAVPKYVIEKMEKLSKYSKFIKTLNEQSVTTGGVNATNIKTVDFSSLLSSFENLADKKITLTDDERSMLNNIRAEIQSRYSKTGAKP